MPRVVDFFLSLRYITNKDKKSEKECFLIKKTFKILGVIALVVSIEFLMVACPDSTNYPEGPKQFITVTDIPSTYNGKYGIIVLSPPGSSDITAYSTREKINETSFKFPLYDGNRNNPWTGIGSYSIKILIYDNGVMDNLIYVGVISNENEEENITETITIIPWSLFTDKT